MTKSWKFPDSKYFASEYFADKEYYGEVGDIHLHRDNGAGRIEVEEWDGFYPVCSWGRGVPQWNVEVPTVQPPAPSAWSTQEGGSHYTKYEIQPFQYSMANKLDSMQHTIVKYVTRFRDKGGIVDLNKAKHVIDLLIEWEQAHAAR